MSQKASLFCSSGLSHPLNGYHISIGYPIIPRRIVPLSCMDTLGHCAEPIVGPFAYFKFYTQKIVI